MIVNNIANARNAKMPEYQNSRKPEILIIQKALR
jgi:hypothetical protein